MSAPRCRRYHPVWLTHAEARELEALVAVRLEDGSYYGNREQYTHRLLRCSAALHAADGNCVDEMERPR